MSVVVIILNGPVIGRTETVLSVWEVTVVQLKRITATSERIAEVCNENNGGRLTQRERCKVDCSSSIDSCNKSDHDLMSYRYSAPRVRQAINTVAFYPLSVPAILFISLLFVVSTHLYDK